MTQSNWVKLVQNRSNLKLLKEVTKISTMLVQVRRGKEKQLYIRIVSRSLEQDEHEEVQWASPSMEAVATVPMISPLLYHPFVFDFPDL
ncbi:hypothetical protein H5410_034814 [Solanum commersonii]|uniref:Uncharacterized protein n=1 Tax=Solanum commersonii TaxID=4109 RepID=A0A9J5YWI5_SOLCO|nr:hypothetical protein H5410_034814 [Solanum commersonii]